MRAFLRHDADKICFTGDSEREIQGICEGGPLFFCAAPVLGAAGFGFSFVSSVTVWCLVAVILILTVINIK